MLLNKSLNLLNLLQKEQFVSLVILTLLPILNHYLGCIGFWNCDLYKYSLGIYAYKNQEILQNFSRPHDYYTRNRDELLNPFNRLRSTEQSVISSAVKLWVNIPADVKNSVNELTFKVKFKEFLISQYSNWIFIILIHCR